MDKKDIREAFKEAFPKTIPLLPAFLFLGISYGIYIHILGFGPIYVLAMSGLIYAGSMEFIAGGMLTGDFVPFEIFIITLLVNARHLFYGISMLDKYGPIGKLKYYLIFGMCDEAFSINYTSFIPAHIKKEWFYFWVTLLTQIYWVGGAVLGNVFGSFITFNTKGIEFVLTALFIVLMVEQWKATRNTFSTLLGLVVPAISLYIWGPSNFMIPSMIGIVICLTMIRSRYEGRRR